jgi:hypothetical protein
MWIATTQVAGKPQSSMPGFAIYFWLADDSGDMHRRSDGTVVLVGGRLLLRPTTPRIPDPAWDYNCAHRWP